MTAESDDSGMAKSSGIGVSAGGNSVILLCEISLESGKRAYLANREKPVWRKVAADRRSGGCDSGGGESSKPMTNGAAAINGVPA